MVIPFVKMHGLGNDFLVIDGRAADPDQLQARAAQLCDRHFGVGGDGLLLWTGGSDAPRMTVVNADGSVPEMCGNGLRCFAKYLGDRTHKQASQLEILTGAGPLQCTLHRDADGRVQEVTVAMGRASWEPQAVGLRRAAPLLGEPLGDLGLRFSALSTGNPHAVTFDAVTDAERLRLGPLLCADPLFAHQANIEFARIDRAEGQPRIFVDVYERGCGWTLACGTGATATTFEAARQGLVPTGPEIAVHLPGGWLHIAIASDGTARMRGPAHEVFSGTVGA